MSTAESRSGGRGRGDLILQVVALVGAQGQFGGPTTVAVGQTAELAARGRAVGFFALREGVVSPPPGLRSDSWHTFAARTVVPGRGMLGQFNLRLAAALWAQLGRATVVHVHAGRDLVSLCALVLARARRVAVVAQTHGMIRPRDSWATRLFDLAFLRLLRSAIVLYLTPGERDELRQMLGEAADLRFLGNGLAPGEPGASRAGPRPVVVFAARLHPVKRVGVFLEAAQILIARGVDADFAVLGPDQGDLPLVERAVHHPASAGRVRYDGARGHAETVQALAAAAVVVLPSSQDWMPMTLLEAMAAGVPTVSTKSCGLAEVIDEAGAGMIVEGHPSDVADAIATVLSDRGRADEMGARARDLVRRQFSLDRVVDQLEDIYRDAYAGT